MSALSFESPLDLAREANVDPPRGRIDRKKKIYGVVTGQVIPHPPDPQALGRVLVRIPCIDSLDFVAWARVAVPMAGPFHGTYFIPNPGDDVLIAFEHGDVKVPYVVGSLWNHISRPPLPVSQALIRTIRTLAGNQMVFTEIPPSITIQTATPPVPIPMPPSSVGPHSTIAMMPGVIDVSAKVVVLRSGANSVTLAEGLVAMQAGTNSIVVTPEGISIVAGANVIKIGANGILIQGTMVNINPV